QSTTTTYGAIAINVTTGTNIVIRDNVFQNLQQKAVNIESGRYVDVIGNIITNVATTSLSGGHGIMRQQGTGVFGTADEAGNYRWDISGNLIFNVQQRLYSWVPSKGYMNFSFDEGKPINIDETTDTSMIARIADNVIAFPAIDAIRLKPTANLEVSNNSIYATASIADGITDANTLSVSTPFPGMTIRNNLIETAPGRFGLEVHDGFPTTTDTGRVSGNILSGGTANPAGLPGVTSVSTGLFTNPNAGVFTPAAGVSTAAGANPPVLANLTRKAAAASITVASDGWVNDGIKLTQTLLDAVPGVEDGVSGNETIFTGPGQYTASVREAGRKSMLFPVNSTWQAANVAAADLAVAGGKYEIITSADYSAWRDATQTAYTGYGSVRWGDSVVGQNKVFDAAGLTVMAVRGVGDFTKTVATGKTVTIDGDLLVDLSTYSASGTQTFDIVKAGTVTSANGVGATFDTIRIKQPAGGAYTAQVALVDTDANSVADTVRLTVVGGVVVNGAPTDIALSVATVAENLAAGSTVGTLASTDPNPGDTFTYTLVSGTGSTDNSAFTIVGNALKTAASFDFETKSSYSVRVRSTDAGGLTVEKAFTISVTNVNEAPTDIALTAATVAENSAVGTTVGTLSSTDPDAGDTFTYTLVSGTGSTDNSAFTIVGNALKTAASFDFETKSSYSVRVRSTDAGGLTVEKAFTISVTNVNEAPTDIALSAATVAVNSSVGTTVGTLSSTDPDAGDTFTYTLVSGSGSTENSAFTIVGNTIKTATTFNLA
ncbi:MAG: cadherin domain-containing protein, partial [Ilumatobacteraceae bacterium]